MTRVSEERPSYQEANGKVNQSRPASFPYLAATLLAFVLAPSLCSAGPTSVPDRMVAWLLQPGGRLALLIEDGLLVGRRYESAGNVPFDLNSVGELWLVTRWYRERAYVVNGTVTAVTAWSVINGSTIDPSLLPAPPPPVLELFYWPGYSQPREAPAGGGAVVDAMVAREAARLGLSDTVLDTVAGGQGRTGRPAAAGGGGFAALPANTGGRMEATISRSLKVGFDHESSDQPNSVPPVESTTRDAFVEFEYEYSLSNDFVDKSADFSASIGSNMDEFSLEYVLGRPTAAPDKLKGTVSASVEKDKSDDTSAADTTTLGLDVEASKVLSSVFELTGSLGLDSVAYSGDTSDSFDNDEKSFSVGINHYGASLETSLLFSLSAMSYPDDPAGDYDDASIEVSTSSGRGKFEWELGLTRTNRDYDDTDSVSVQSGTTNADYTDNEISLSTEWRFRDDLTSEFTMTWLRHDYDSPDDSNFDYDSFEFGPAVDWTIGDGWSCSMNLSWKKDRYVDRDGDDGTTTPLVEETADDVDSRNLDLSIMYSGERLDCSLSLGLGKDHYPNGNQGILDENVDGRNRNVGLTLTWRMTDDWLFDLSAERSREEYDNRPEDDTRTDTLTASVTKKY